jgi:hypothetical protein
MREYVQAAMEFLASECPEGPSRILKGFVPGCVEIRIFGIHA